MDASDFIVPPPGLIPNAPEPGDDDQERGATDRSVHAPPRAFPVFTPTTTDAPRIVVPSGPPAAAPTDVPVAPAVVMPSSPPAPPPVVPSAPTSAPPVAWRLTAANGSVIALDGSIVVGRDPVIDAATGEPPGRDLRSLSVDDPARSVSKTHARFDLAPDGVRVTDLHSTNGVRVWPAGAELVEIAPGEPFAVPDGATVFLGDLGFRLDRVPGPPV